MDWSRRLQLRLSSYKLNCWKRLLLLHPGLDVAVRHWPSSIESPRRFYIETFRYYEQRLPPVMREHRRYFASGLRGFGDNELHAMWYWLFREFKFQRFLEIGVYRGQTLTLAALLQQHFHIQGIVVGISPFLPVGDSVSEYRKDVDYLADTKTNFERFGLPAPRLVRAYSTDSEAINVLDEGEWDCIYIDGSHEYPVVRSDWQNSSRNLAKGGVVVLDDAALYTNFTPPFGTSKGHPGPSRVADEIGGPFKEILRVGHNRVFQSPQ